MLSSCPVIPGVAWIVRHRQWYVLRGHSASESGPGKLAKRYDFTAAGFSSFHPSGF